MGEARSYSVDEGRFRSIPIKVESAAQPRVFSPQSSRSISIDQQAHKHDGMPPSKTFGVRQTEPYRELPVQLERRQQTSDNLRQLPINIESAGTKFSPKQLLIEKQFRDHPERQIPVERDGIDKHVHPISHDVRKPDAPREIPIKRELKQEPFDGPNPFRREMLASDMNKPPPSYHTDVTDSYDENIMKAEDRHRSELKRKEMELKRDIDNVILEAINQVPVYKQTRSATETKPRTIYPRQMSVEDEVIMPSMVESPRQQRVDQALQQQNFDKEQKNLIQKRWEEEKRLLDEKHRQMEERERMRQTTAGSYATLPIKKQSSVEVASVEQEPGSYSTLPSYRLRAAKAPGSPTVARSYDHDVDRNYFSDAETTRRTPTWRPVASPLAKRSGYRPSPGSTTVGAKMWTPSASPGLERKPWSSYQAPPSQRAPANDGFIPTTDFVPGKGRREMHVEDRLPPA